MRLEPKNIQLIGNELAVQWNDGGESYFPLERLRRACPVLRVAASRTCWAISRGRM